MADCKISIGGQALLEGIMMKGPDKYSVAVRKPDGTIDIETHEVKKSPVGKIPFVRGVYNFIDSLKTGYTCLMHSAEVSMGSEYEEDKFEIWLREKFGEKASGFITMLAGILGTVLALVLFMILPTAITGFINRFLPLGALKRAVEGITKMLIFFCYLWAISNIKDIQRVYMYHGAEHKTIFCFEEGLPLTVENVRKQTRFHPRCGTSFLFIVLFVSIVVFSFVPWTSTFQRALMKVLFLPVVVSIAYEILKFTGTHENGVTKALAAPGLWFQRLTTKEPDDSMIEVAIASVNAVLPQTIIKKETDTESE